MQLLKQSTAVSKIVGPILDSTGAEYASAVIGDLSLSKNGATLTALASAASLTYIANGMYTLALTTGNTDTLGSAEISCNKATYQMPPREFMVLPATVYDALVTNATNTTGGLPAATGAISALAGAISTLTQTQVSGGAYALNSASFGFNAALDFTTTQKAATLARVTLVDTVTTVTGGATASELAKVPKSDGTATWNNTALASINAEADAALADAKAGYAAAVEAAILDEGDATALLAAIGAKVETFLINDGDATATIAAIAAAVWANAARTLTAGTNIVLAKGTGVTGFNDLSAAQVNAEADTALADYDPPTKAELDSGLAALNNVSTAQVQTAAAAALTAYDPPTKAEMDSAIAALFTTAMAESYNADGSPPTPAQALFVIMQTLTEMSIAGTTTTVKKLDGSTTAFTLTLNDGTTPTAVTRAT